MDDPVQAKLLVALVILPAILAIYFVVYLVWLRPKWHKEALERRASWQKTKDDFKRILETSPKRISEAFEQDWKADRFPPHVLTEKDVVITYRFDGTKPPQPGLIFKGFATNIAAIFDDKSSGSSAGIYALSDDRLREIIRANPNADFTKFEDAFSITILDVQRKSDAPSGGGIYIGE